MLKNDSAFRKRAGDIADLKYRLGAYALGHSFYFAEEECHYSVYCFPTLDAAETFLDAFSGELLPPADRKKCNWRPRSAVPDSGIYQIYRLGQQCRLSEP